MFSFPASDDAKTEISMYIFCVLQIEYFDEDAFKDLCRLTILRLDGNQLSVISADLLSVQKSLEHLGECCLHPPFIHRIYS